MNTTTEYMTKLIGNQIIEARMELAECKQNIRSESMCDHFADIQALTMDAQKLQAQIKSLHETLNRIAECVARAENLESEVVYYSAVDPVSAPLAWDEVKRLANMPQYRDLREVFITDSKGQSYTVLEVRQAIDHNQKGMCKEESNV